MNNIIEWIVGIYLSIGVLVACIALIVLIMCNHLKDYSLYHNIGSTICCVFLWPYAVYQVLIDHD